MDNNPADEDPWTDDLPLPPGWWRSQRGNMHDNHGEYANDIMCQFLDDNQFGECIPHPEDGMAEAEAEVKEEETPDEPVKYEYKCSFESATEFLEDVKKDMPRNLNKKYGIRKIGDLQHIWSSEASLRDWLLQEHPDTLKVAKECNKCGNKKLGIDSKSRVRCYNCMNRNNVSSVSSAWKNSFFDGCKGGRHEMMKFLCHWLTGATTKQIAIYTGWSKSKAIEWTKKVQALTACIVVNDHQMIGGPGVVVEIDESKFGERKHDKGKRVEGAWVFGGVELTPERRFFCVVVEDRKASTLTPIIKSHMAPGSIIRSDCWKAHDVINFQAGCDCVHEKVNHSETYRSDEGADTNTIEGTWAGVKRMVPVRKRTKKQLPGCLFEFIWRRRNEGNLWNGLLRALEEVYCDDDWLLLVE